jgi:hypothetical protein
MELGTKTHFSPELIAPLDIYRVSTLALTPLNAAPLFLGRRENIDSQSKTAVPVSHLHRSILRQTSALRETHIFSFHPLFASSSLSMIFIKANSITLIFVGIVAGTVFATPSPMSPPICELHSAFECASVKDLMSNFYFA